MAVRIVHGADFHMDSPFDGLPAGKAAQRRAEQRDRLEEIADLVRQTGAQLVLLAGDLFDSTVAYYETVETLTRVLSRLEARVFIAPGNHDHYCAASPYASREFPENVHIFTGSRPEPVVIPELRCRVWGAAFRTEESAPLLKGFTVPESDLTEIMVLHGEVGGRVYNPISPADIADSGLHYLALGHIHTFSGVQKAGGTVYAYPGCPEGRGFDECGPKGLLTGTVSRGSCELRFQPLGGREYGIWELDLTGWEDVYEAIRRAAPEGRARDVFRLVLGGQYGGSIDPERVAAILEGCFYHLSVRNETRPPRDLWDGWEEDTLRGLFLRSLRRRFEEAENDGERRLIAAAARCGIAALENREEWRS